MSSHEEFVIKKLKVVSSLIAPGSSVLDVGCNEAIISKFLSNCDYYGIDVDKKTLIKLKQKGLNVKYCDLNLNKIPFTNQKFDYILALDILEHLANPQNLLRNLKKMLSSNGRIIITMPNDYHLLNKIRFILNKPLSKDPLGAYDHLHTFPIYLGQKMLLDQDFRIIKKIYLSPVKPKFMPQLIKDLLSRFFPNNFSRDVLYVVSNK
jgi:methionine biosynthesis protein MetW